MELYVLLIFDISLSFLECYLVLDVPLPLVQLHRFKLCDMWASTGECIRWGERWNCKDSSVGKWWEVSDAKREKEGI